MYQACVRATPANPNHTLIGFTDETDRDEFCKHDPQVFWYVYVEDIEFEDGPGGIAWQRGSAWAAAERLADTIDSGQDDGGERW